MSLKRGGVVVAVLTHDQAGAIVRKHMSGPSFQAAGKNYWTVPLDLAWHLVLGTVAAGAFILEYGPDGKERSAYISFVRFPVGITGNGDAAFGIKVAIKPTGGRMDVITAFPIHQPSGRVNFFFFAPV